MKFQKLDAFLRHAATDVTGLPLRVMIRFADDDKAGARVRERLRARGCTVQKGVPCAGLIVARVNRTDLAALEADPDVLGVSFDAVILSKPL